MIVQPRTQHKHPNLVPQLELMFVFAVPHCARITKKLQGQPIDFTVQEL